MNLKYMLQQAALQSPYPEKQPSRRTKHQLKNLKGGSWCSLPCTSVWDLPP